MTWGEDPTVDLPPPNGTNLSLSDPLDRTHTPEETEPGLGPTLAPVDRGGVLPT